MPGIIGNRMIRKRKKFYPPIMTIETCYSTNAHWEDFLIKGQKTADLFRKIYATKLNSADGDRTKADAAYEDDVRELNPEFHDWILKIFPRE